VKPENDYWPQCCSGLLHFRDGWSIRSSATFVSGSVGQLSKPNLDTRKMYKRLEERKYFDKSFSTFLYYCCIWLSYSMRKTVLHKSSISEFGRQ